MRLGIVLAASFTLAAGLHAGVARAAAPDPKICPRTPAVESDTIERKGPLAIPAQFAGIARSGLARMAILTLTGQTYCLDIHAVGDAREYALTPDKRFFSFEWFGYEEGGYYLIDRIGRGQVVDTGAAPVASPTGRLLAAVEYSESGFGSLNGFAVWRIETAGLRQVVKIDVPSSMSEWRLDGWSGETCVRLSAIPFDRMPENTADVGKTRRDRFVARLAGKTWAIIPAARGVCPAR